MKSDMCCRKRVIVTVIVCEVVIIAIQLFVIYPCFLPHGPSDVLSQNSLSYSLFGFSHKESLLNDTAKFEVSKPVTGTDGKYSADWESLDSRPLPRWYDEAKIGIFLHWGVYSVPSYTGTGTRGYSEWFWYWWQGNTTRAKYQSASRSVQKYMEERYSPEWQYKDFAPQFTAEFFEPNRWADIFEASGAKYVVLTSKHHDGFTLFGSDKSKGWNSVDIGPKRDLVGELATAVRAKQVMHFGLYHSLYEWFHPLYIADKSSGFQDQTYVKDKLMPELRDMVNRYVPDIVWSDGQWEAPCEYWQCTEFLVWLYNDSPVKDIVVTNDRWGNGTACKHGGFLTCHDHFNPANSDRVMTRKWENCMTIDRESWGFRRNAQLSEYFSMDELTDVLIQTVSYGGNLLMNVGPTADGRIIPIFEERLRQLGSWLKVNGDAIYGTTMWMYPKDPVIPNVYYTRKRDVVFALVTSWPTSNLLRLTAVTPTENTVVKWEGQNGNLVWRKLSNRGIEIVLPDVTPENVPCEWAWAFRLTHLK